MDYYNGSTIFVTGRFYLISRFPLRRGVWRNGFEILDASTSEDFAKDPKKS